MIIWIASYPKSGNTWIRYFLKSYFNPANQELTLKSTKNDSFYTLNFPNLSLLKEMKIEYSNFSNIIKNWIPMQEFINLNGKTNFFKTHNAMCTINNYPFTNKDNTCGAIYVVRDPRDVVISYANHLRLSHEKTIERMFDSQNGENQPGDDKRYNSTLTGTWSHHYNSWKTYKDRKILIIKYEDLLFNTYETFVKIIKYLSQVIKTEIDENKIEYAIEETRFQNLQLLEKKEGFEEKGMGEFFFRRGTSGNWKNDLEKNLIKKIEEKFKDEMTELGYLRY